MLLLKRHKQHINKTIRNLRDYLEHLHQAYDSTRSITNYYFTENDTAICCRNDVTKVARTNSVCCRFGDQPVRIGSSHAVLCVNFFEYFINSMEILVERPADTKRVCVIVCDQVLGSFVFISGSYLLRAGREVKLCE